VPRRRGERAVDVMQLPAHQFTEDISMHEPTRVLLAVVCLATLPGLAAAQGVASDDATGSSAPMTAVATTGQAGPVAQPGLAAAQQTTDVDAANSTADQAADAADDAESSSVSGGSDVSDAAVEQQPAGPSLAAATVGVRAHTAKEDFTAQQSAQRAAHHGGLGTDGALMIVGGAAFIAGLIIGGGAGTAIAIAGAAIGLYGLYLYLQ
jgi:hypothetical protein